jgi:glycosyl transferase family 87
LALYLACGLAAGTISWSLGQSKNLLVFRHASEGLLAGRDLYAGGFVDYFKYSPTFALLFLPFSIAPAWIAAEIWAVLNFGIAFVGIDAVVTDERPKRVALAAALPGILLATDGDQANLLVTGTMLFAFASFERGRNALGAASTALGALVKIFPLAAVAFALLHKGRERTTLRVVVAIGVGVLLPLVVVSPSALAAQYASWGHLLDVDRATRGWSLVTIARDAGVPGHAAQIAGALVLGATLLAGCGRKVDAGFRRTFAASVLVACVLFNHRSEYCSFVISAVGVALWYAERPSALWRILLFACATIAHGPFFALDRKLSGVRDLFTVARLYHPLHVAPLAAVWIAIQLDLVLPLLKRAPRVSRRELAG